MCVCEGDTRSPPRPHYIMCNVIPTISSLCINAVSALGPMSLNSLVWECMEQTGKPSDEVREAVIEWTERLGVERDEWGGFYLPGAGGMM